MTINKTILKHFTSFCLLFFVCCKVEAQYNLVPNYSFENYIICPNFSQNTISPPPPPWYKPTKVGYQHSYFNACSTDPCSSVPYNCLGVLSYQPAKTGQAYDLISPFAGFQQNARWYIQNKLIDSLKKNKRYYVEFYVSLCDVARRASDNVGLWFSNTAKYVDTLVDPDYILPANPQIINYGNPIITDTMNWVKVSGIFKAQGGEQFITIGNFKFDNQTNTKIVNTNGGCDCAEYYLDDVSVIPLDSMCLKADAGRDTTIKLGDSVFIGSYTNGLDSVKWFNGLTVIDSIRPGFWVRPTSIGTYMYVLQQTVNGCFSKDTVYVNVTTLPLKIMSYELRVMNDNPNSSPRGNERSVENIWQTANGINVSHYNIQRSTNGKDFTTIGTIKANNQPQDNYSFRDLLTTSHLPLTLYYRIVGVDLDGRKTYSSVKSITTSHLPLAINIYPNPAKDVVNVESNDAIKEVKLFDMFGREIATGTNLRNEGINTNHLSLNINHYPKGLYMLQVRLVNDVIVNSKLLIE